MFFSNCVPGKWAMQFLLFTFCFFSFFAVADKKQNEEEDKVEYITVKGAREIYEQQKIYDEWMQEVLDEINRWREDLTDRSDSLYEDGDIRGAGKDKNSCGNPVMLSDGRKVETEYDYQGKEISPIEFIRHYSSRNNHIGSMGPGWGIWLDRRLVFQNNSTAKVYNEHGQHVELQVGSHKIPYIGIQTAYVTGNGRSYLYKYTDNYWYFKAADDRYYVFDQQGKLVKVSFGLNPHGFGVSHSVIYSNGKVSSVVHSNGHKLSIAWNNNRIVSIKDPDNNYYKYDYDHNGVLSKVTFPEQQSKIYHYEDSRFKNALTGVTLGSGRYSWFIYNNAGRVIESRHADNYNRLKFEYNNDYTRVDNALGHHSIYNFDDDFRLSSVSTNGSLYCPQSSETYWYDVETGMLNKERDRNGNIIEYKYLDGRLLSRALSPGNIDSVTFQYKWHPVFDLPIEVISSSGVTFRYDYDLHGNPISREKISSGKYQKTSLDYQYYPSNVIKSIKITSPINDVSYYYFSSEGNLTRLVNNVGHITEFSQYNHLGQPRKVLHPDGTSKLYQYDKRGRVIKQEFQAATGQKKFIEYGYNRFSKISYEYRSNGYKVNYSYNNAGFLSEEERQYDGKYYYKFYYYNLIGNIIKTEDEDPSHRVLVCEDEGTEDEWCDWEISPTNIYNYSYDAQGYLGKIHNHSGELVASYYYDGNGNVSSIKDGEGNEELIKYDSENRKKMFVDPYGKVTNFLSDAKGLYRVDDARMNSTLYIRNSDGEPEKLDSPDSGISYFYYNDDNKLEKSIDSIGKVTTFSYDGIGRLKRRQNDNLVNFRHDEGAYSKGKISGFEDHSGGTNYSYNSWGAISSQLSNISGSNYKVEWKYDNIGRVNQLIYPGGNTLNYNYDLYGFLSSITVDIQGSRKTVISNIKQNPLGPVTSWQYGNGVVRNLFYDKNYRLTGISSSNIQLLNYQYSSSGNIIKITDSISPSNNQTFVYDKLNRLVSVANGSLNYSFIYDDVGNRKERTGYLAESYTIDDNSNRLLKVTRGNQSRIFSYDNNGNVIHEKKFDNTNFLYTYDSDNRMLKAGLAEYKYNALGARVYKKYGNVETHFIYDQEGALLAEGNKKQYIYFQKQPVAYIENNEIFYIHNDYLGRPEILTNKNKIIVWRAKLEAFDRSVLNSSIGDFNIGFPGQYWDVEKKSWYNYSRDYDATIGRYLQSDPIGLEAGVNTYTYVAANPLNYIDEFGLKGHMRPNPMREQQSRHSRYEAQAELSYRIATMRPSLACRCPTDLNGKIGMDRQCTVTNQGKDWLPQTGAIAINDQNPCLCEPDWNAFDIMNHFNNPPSLKDFHLR